MDDAAEMEMDLIIGMLAEGVQLKEIQFWMHSEIIKLTTFEIELYTFD